MEFVRSKGGYFDVAPDDYCKGNFEVSETVDAYETTMAEETSGMSSRFAAAFPDVEETEVPEGFAEGVMARIQTEASSGTATPA